MTIHEYVTQRINQIFTDLAEQVASGEIDTSDYTEDEAAGIPFQLFTANALLLTAWREIFSQDDSELVEYDESDPDLPF